MNSLSSKFLKKPQYSLSIARKNGQTVHVVDPKAIRAMLALMNMQAVMGGAASHWGGPSAFAEITSSLSALVFEKGPHWQDYFHVINDAGHCENGLYAIKTAYQYAGLTLDDLKQFRSIKSFLTGHGESHLFPQGVYLSNGPLGSTMAQAQGLCLADHLQKKNRTTALMVSDGGLMEGEAKEVLASIPGLAGKGLMNPFLMIVSNNDTKLSGRISGDSFPMNPSLKSLSALGWQVIHLDSPHDLEKTFHCMDQALDKAKGDPQIPIAVNAQTIKGYGVEKTKKDPSGGHGFPLKTPEALPDFIKEIYQDQAIPEEFLKWCDELVQKHPPSSSAEAGDLKSNSFHFSLEPREKVQAGISKALIKKYEQGCPLVSISADLQGSTGVAGFRKKFPNRAFDVGVAESNMFGAAVGFSKQGFIPVVDTFAQFGVTKGALPLFMAGLSSAPVIAFLSHIGFQSAGDGASHQCLTYLAQTGSIPNTCIYTLSSSAEAQSLVEQAVDVLKKEGKSFIFFLGREKFPASYLPPDYSYKLGKAQVALSRLSGRSKACTIAVSGTLLEQALKAGELLSKEGWDIIVIHPSLINAPDIETFSQSLSKTKGNLLTVEDHQIKGGMAGFLSHALSMNNIPYKIHCLGVHGGFGRSAYQAIDLYQQHGLDHLSIVKAVQNHF